MIRHRHATKRRPSATSITVVSVVTAVAALALSAGCVVVEGDPVQAPAHRVERSFEQTFDPAGLREVVLENLAGTMSIEPAEDDRLSIEATIHGAADTVAEAESVAGSLRVDAAREGDRVVVHAVYPVDEHSVYHYPRGGGDELPAFLRWLGGSRTSTSYQGRRVSVVSTPRSDSLTLYADFVIRVPAGVGASVDLAIGSITASGLEGRLLADTGAGTVRVTGSRGELDVDTGSGSVEVADHEGEVRIDTGSGEVVLQRVSGSVVVDTGSGSVDLSDIDGDRVVASTGSGAVRLERVAGSLELDTGSGSIVAVDLRARARLHADTGSGSVRLSGDMSGVEEVVVDTGSGSVRLEMAPAPEMRLRVSTGSGGIDVEVPGIRVVREERNYFEGEVGTGRARVDIDTGSGGVTVKAG